MADESVQLKILQTILIVFQSRLQPDDEVMIQVFRLLTISMYFIWYALDFYFPKQKLSSISI